MRRLPRTLVGLGALAGLSCPMTARSTPSWRVPVLMYHRVADLSPREARSALLRDLTVAPSAFAKQVSFLVGSGYQLLTAADVAAMHANGRPITSHSVAITFDDGYHDVFVNAFPVLHAIHARATIFVNTAMVGKARHVTWGDLRAMAADGWEVGSHSVTHRDMAHLPREAVRREAMASSQAITAAVGRRPTTFCYPCGGYSAVAMAEVRAAGYTGAWRKSGGPVGPGAPQFALPRVRVSGTLGSRGFEALVGR